MRLARHGRRLARGSLVAVDGKVAERAELLLLEPLLRALGVERVQARQRAHLRAKAGSGGGEGGGAQCRPSAVAVNPRRAGAWGGGGGGGRGCTCCPTSTSSMHTQQLRSSSGSLFTSSTTHAAVVRSMSRIVAPVRLCCTGGTRGCLGRGASPRPTGHARWRQACANGSEGRACRCSTNSRRMSSSSGVISRACNLRSSCSCRSCAVAGDRSATLLIAAASAPIALLLLCGGTPLIVPQYGQGTWCTCRAWGVRLISAQGRWGLPRPKGTDREEVRELGRRQRSNRGSQKQQCACGRHLRPWHSQRKHALAMIAANLWRSRCHRNRGRTIRRGGARSSRARRAAVRGKPRAHLRPAHATAGDQTSHPLRASGALLVFSVTLLK